MHDRGGWRPQRHCSRIARDRIECAGNTGQWSRGTVDKARRVVRGPPWPSAVAVHGRETDSGGGAGTRRAATVDRRGSRPLGRVRAWMWSPGTVGGEHSREEGRSRRRRSCDNPRQDWAVVSRLGPRHAGGCEMAIDPLPRSSMGTQPWARDPSSRRQLQSEMAGSPNRMVLLPTIDSAGGISAGAMKGCYNMYAYM